jgi:hypothetical protein
MVRWRWTGSLLTLLTIGCSAAESIDDCPQGTVPVRGSCLVACLGPSDCLPTETCDPVRSACIPAPDGPDGGPIADAAPPPQDSGGPPDAGLADADDDLRDVPIGRDVVQPRDGGFIDGGGPTDAPLGPDTGPRPDGGVSLSIMPPAVDFGARPLGCSSMAQPISASPVGAAVTVVDLRIDGPQSFTFSAAATPRLVPLGQGFDVVLRHQPGSLGREEASLEIETIEAGTFAVPLAGTGIEPEVTDTFQQVPDQVDVVLVIDDSASMAQHQMRMAIESTALLNHLQANRYDFHIGVTTTDPSPPIGAFHGAPIYLTPTSPNLAVDLRMRVVPGTSGSATEQGLGAAIGAVTPPLINGLHAGFLRPDAALMVVILSDEDDASATDPNNAIAAITGTKSSASMVAINAIVSTTLSCGVSIGTAYINVAAATGGVVADLCAPSWATAVTSIPPSAVPPTVTFSLSQRPDPATIQVQIDGVIQPPNTWVYAQGANQILFPPNFAPPYASEITVRYQRGCP